MLFFVFLLIYLPDLLPLAIKEVCYEVIGKELIQNSVPNR